MSRGEDSGVLPVDVGMEKEGKIFRDIQIVIPVSFCGINTFSSPTVQTNKWISSNPWTEPFPRSWKSTSCPPRPPPPSLEKKSNCPASFTLR